MTWRRPALSFSIVVISGCVAYNIAGPSVPSVAGTYTTTIAVRSRSGPT